jgi:hypothetical protein
MELSPEEKALVEAHRKGRVILDKQEMEKVLKCAEADKFVPKEYTNEEKIKAFDGLYRMAVEHLEEVRKDGYAAEDFDHWCCEAVMGLLGNGVWDAVNAYTS